MGRGQRMANVPVIRTYITCVPIALPLYSFNTLWWYAMCLIEETIVTVGHFFHNEILRKHSRPRVSGQRLQVALARNRCIARKTNVAILSIAQKIMCRT